MNDFSILQEEILLHGLLKVYKNIELIQDALFRASERYNFYKVMGTFPIVMEQVNKIDTVLVAQQFIKD